MTTAIIFILILGVLIFVHELGHFVVARRNGIRADEFGFGFPPRIIGIQRYFDKNGKYKKWRIIFGRRDGDQDSEHEARQEIKKKGYEKGTIYSLNWLPLGGFVRIKGEDGEGKNDPDSFASKGAWPRIKVLAAGVVMNFVLAWFLIAVSLVIGVPEDFLGLVGEEQSIVIEEVSEETPAKSAGIISGDIILKKQGDKTFNSKVEFIQYVNEKKGEEISLSIEREGKIMDLKLTPRKEFPEGQGPIGVSFTSSIKKFPWYSAIWNGLVIVAKVIWLIIYTLGLLIKNLFTSSQSMSLEVAGPVGIAIMVKDAAEIGMVALMIFVAFLSINLGIINILPIPALDGGRILFILIEKIKGSPVSQKIEQSLHFFFFVILILLMVFVTFRDVLKNFF